MLREHIFRRAMPPNVSRLEAQRRCHIDPGHHEPCVAHPQLATAHISPVAYSASERRPSGGRRQSFSLSRLALFPELWHVPARRRARLTIFFLRALLCGAAPVAGLAFMQPHPALPPRRPPPHRPWRNTRRLATYFAFP